MKKLVLTLVLLTVIISGSYSQLKERDNLLGASIGFWGKGQVPMFGVNFENQVTQAGVGTLGLGGLARIYSYSQGYSNGDSWKYTFTSLGFQANYNFNQISDGSFVPFIGLVLGYNNVSNTYTNVTNNGVYVSESGYSSGAWAWGQLGMRYFFSPRVAGSVRAGFGNNDFSTIELGLDFKF
jgi:hypothetical protein